MIYFDIKKKLFIRPTAAQLNYIKTPSPKLSTRVIVVK